MPSLSRFGRRTPPRVRGGRSILQAEFRDYSKGVNTYSANDVVDPQNLRYATDGRINTLGRYRTRQGADFYTNPVGETLDDAETSTAGAGNVAVGKLSVPAIKFTPTATGRLTKVELNIKNSASATGVVNIKIYSDSGGEPGTLIGETSLDFADIDTSYGYDPARLIEAPEVTASSDYWIVPILQDNGTNQYYVSSTTNATTALTSADGGLTWSATAYDINFKTYISTDIPTLGLHRAYKSNGTKTTLIAGRGNLYTVNDSTGALTSINSTLDTSATKYRFATVNDTVYYVNGVDAPRKWDFTTEAVTGGSPDVATNIMLFKNQMFYVDADDPTKLFWSDIADYETFTSTNFTYVPSPKHPDPITALHELNGSMIVFKSNSKYLIYGSDLATFEQYQSPGQKGTYSQESTVSYRNYIFFASDDGIYQFNGTSDKNIATEILGDYMAIGNKDKIVLNVYNNRLYVFHPSPGSGYNDRCWVYNFSFGSWESLDLNTPVNRAITLRPDVDRSRQIIGSSYVCQAYYNEQSSNNYSQLGAPLTWEIRTRYEHYDDPASKKRPKRWYPRFERLNDSYNVTASYDKDFEDSPTETTIDLSGGGTEWGGSDTWGGGIVWGTDKLSAERLTVPGTAKYVQYRYKRSGVNTPVEFTGHTFLFKRKRAR